MDKSLHTFFAAEADAGSTWARDVAADGITYVYMPDGRGDRFREATKAGRYVCPLDECSAKLRVAAGQINRHHWRHHVAPIPAHAPESMWHLAAKAAIADWVATVEPTAEIIVDSRKTPAGLKPDVWVRAGSLNVAFELQMSSLESRDLRGRTDRYACDGVTPVWLFGHRRPPHLPDEDEPIQAVRLTQEHQAAADVGPLRWLNPDQREVATAYLEETARVDERVGQRFRMPNIPTITYVRHPTRHDRRVLIRIDSLDECTLDATGMHTPTDTWIEEQIAKSQLLEREAVEAENAWRTRQAATPGRPTETPSRDQPPTPSPPEPRPAFPMPGDLHRPPALARDRTSHPSESRPCPFCGATPTRRSEWPRWYRPPADTTAVVMCATCDTVLGSVAADL